MVYRPTNQTKLKQLKLAVAAATSLAATGPSSKTPEIAPPAPRNSVPMSSLEPSPASCFLEANGYAARNITPDRADSTVLILNRYDKTSMSLGSVFNSSRGTGFVVGNSAGPDGLNRIVTEQHLTNTIAGKDGKDGYLIYKSNGDFLGTAAVVASGGWHERGDRDVVDDERKGLKDDAVLTMTSFPSRAMEQEFRAIRGFTVAPQQSRDLLKLAISDYSAPPTHGASGGPAFNDKGQIVGIYHSIQLNAPSRQTAGEAIAVSYGNIFQDIVNNRKFMSHTGDAFDSPMGTGFIVPLGDRKIDAALNAAGKGITKAPLTSKLSVTITGFPLDQCSTFQGTLEADPYVPPAGSSHHKKHSKPQAPLRR